MKAKPSPWVVFKNTAAQVVGRLVISVARLIIAGLIVRAYGAPTFGEYSLVLGLLMIAEWMTDFGTTEVFVREICRAPENRRRLLRILSGIKIFQIPAAYAVLAAVLLALRYPPHILEAGLVGGIGLVFFGGVLIYRTAFKAALTIEREVAAELLSVLVMIPLIAWAANRQAGLSTLIGCYAASRGVFLLFCYLFGRGRFRPSLKQVRRQDIRWGLSLSTVIGSIGLLVGVYEAVDLLLLSKLTGAAELAYYSGAQRMVWPLHMALASVGGTLYPVAASYWPHAKGDFFKACERGLDTVVVLAGLAACSLLAGAEFFLGLLGPDLVAGAPVLRIFAVLSIAKAIGSTAGPMLYVVHAQRSALKFISVALAVKVVVQGVLVITVGYIGVAFGALAVEICFAVAPAVYLLRKYSGFRMNWSTPAKAAATAAFSAWASYALTDGGWPGAVTAPALYTAIVLLLGVVKIHEVQSLLRRRTA